MRWNVITVVTVSSDTSSGLIMIAFGIFLKDSFLVFFLSTTVKTNPWIPSQPASQRRTDRSKQTHKDGTKSNFEMDFHMFHRECVLKALSHIDHAVKQMVSVALKDSIRFFKPICARWRHIQVWKSRLAYSWRAVISESGAIWCWGGEALRQGGREALRRGGHCLLPVWVCSSGAAFRRLIRGPSIKLTDFSSIKPVINQLIPLIHHL